MNTISNYTAQLQVIEGVSVIIDVREPAEYQENHIPGSINIPSSGYNKQHYSAFENQKICLVCHSGQRAKKIHEYLILDGYENVKILEQQMQDINHSRKTKRWSVDRQFRMTLGVLLAISLILYINNITYGLIIPAILSTGLIITSIIDRCYMRIAISHLPWNKEERSNDNLKKH